MKRRQVRTSPSAIAAAVAAAFVGWPAAPAVAAVCDWLPATGNWGTAANWSCGVVPTGPAGDTANIASGRTATVDDARSISILNNAGAINIDAFLLTLQASGATANTGTINVGGPSTAALQVGASHNVNNAGGTINVSDGSVINQFGSTISGGVINTTGTGKLVAANNGNNFLSGVTLNGSLDLASATGIQRVTGGLVLNGTASIGANSNFAAQGTQTISGNGTILFADANGSNRINLEGAGTTTLGSGITIRGHTGFIGQQAFVGGAHTLLNQGTINADTAGGTIIVAPNAGLTNQGTLKAEGGGTRRLDTAVDNSAGTLLAADGGVIRFNGMAVTGGTLASAGSGVFRAANNGNNFLNGVTLNGTLDLASATSIQRLSAGSLVLNGTIDIGANSVFASQGAQTISGSGSIVFADANGSNRLNLEAGDLTLGSGITVRGGNGVIGQQAFIGGAATLTNNGTIQADVAGRSITLSVNGQTINNGTLAALNGGTLNLNSPVFGNTGSQIVAGAGSLVLQNGVTLSGDMNLTGAGSFRPSNNSANILSSVTLSGTLDMATATGFERVLNGLTLNNATINIGANSALAPNGVQTIGGTGQIVFADTNGNNRLTVEAGDLTLGSGITVRGQNGIVGTQVVVGGPATLTNQGTITSDGGGTIRLTVNGTTFNQNLMKAEGGTLQIESTVDNSGGVLLAGNNGVVLVSSATISGGQLNSAGNGVFRVTNSGSNFLNGVTLNGVLDMATATGLARTTAGGMTVNGTVNIGANSVLAPQGGQTLDGTGQIVFADGSVNNRLNLEGAGNFTFGSDLTVRGQTGVIGQQIFLGGAANLTNLGTINADGGGTITVNPTGTLTNHGLLRAQNGALAIQKAMTGNGTLRVDSTGAMNLANGGNTQGTLMMGAAGAALNVGTGNLTINSDYTNAAWGSGNSFNRRAGVSGTGQIVAGGDVAQVITGAGVTGGANNYTLTIGNVHVGSTTFDYQIANAGTTGPTLRGAIQTSVNGGNITDARLSGAGVTADNYNAGGPGGNSGNLGVTFTAAGAGALAPLTGQVVNLRSNFENIADQKLNIVLGAGAAAYNLAAGSASPDPVILANQRVGGTGSQVLTVSNTAPAGAFTEGLNANFGANTGDATNNAGSISLLAGGASNGAAMSVGVNTASAGAKSGTVTVNFVSDGTGTSGLGQNSVGSQVIVVSGDVYRLAQGDTTPLSVNFGNLRVGAGASQTLTVQNSAVNDGFSESLNANFGGATGDASHNGGVVNLLAAGSANNSAMSVALDTGTAGAKTGTVVVNYQSDGTGTSGLAAIAAGGQTINLSGNVFQVAQGQLNTAALNFGTVQVGQAVQQTLSISNTATGAAGFVEDLNASFGASSGQGAAQIFGTGSISGLVAGGTNASNMVVNVNTGTAGVINGAIAVNFFSAGAVNGVSNGLGVLSVVSDSYNVSGTIITNGQVIDQARPVTNGVLSPGAVTVNLGNVRVGGAAQQALSVLNEATGNEQAALNASIASNGAPVTASGSFNLLLPGQTNNSSLVVGIDTASAGAKNGSATIAFVSDASNVGGCEPNCQLNLPSQNVNVTGGVFQVAQPNVPASVDLGNFRLGAAPTQAISIGNTDISPAGYQEGLDASVLGTTGRATAGGGPIVNLVQGGTSNAISVGINNATATAGVNTGTVTLALASNGTVSGLQTLGLADAVIDVSAAGYRLANPTLNTPTVTINARVGDAVAANQAVSIGNTSPDIYTEGLKVAITGASGNAQHNGGSIANLAAQGTNNTAIQVGLASTAAAGQSSGSVALKFDSTGAGTTGAPDTDAQTPTGLVNVIGNVFQRAVGAVLGAIDFGIVRVGDAVSAKNATVSNTAAVVGDGSYNDTLAADFASAGVGKFATGGSASGIVAGGGTNAPGSLTVALDTSAAGVFSDAQQVVFRGQNGLMADDLTLAGGSLLMTAQVNAYANPLFAKVGGAGSFGCAGLVCSLDLGNVLLGAGPLSAELSLTNSVVNPADSLKGLFDLALVDDFAAGGSWINPVDLLPGNVLAGLNLSFDPLGLGLFTDTIFFDGLSYNASDPDGVALARYTLNLRINVVEQKPPGGVPEPGTIALLLTGLAALAARRRGRAQ